MELKELQVKRSSIKGRLTKFKNYLNVLTDESTKLTSMQSTLLHRQIIKYQTLETEFEDMQDRLEILNSEELEAELDIRELIEQDFSFCFATANMLINPPMENKPSSGLEVQGNSSVNSEAHSFCGLGFKPPTLQINKFDGTYSKWLEFRDLYSALVHNNKRIPLPIKFCYLNSYLEGDAARVISNLEVSEANYEKAWSLLQDRFDNKRLLIKNHLTSLLGIEPMSCESSKLLRQLVDNINKNLRALTSLEQPTDTWDAIIIHIMSAKLDNATRLKWEERCNTLTGTPTLTDFNQFINDRANVLEHYDSKQSSSHTPYTGSPKPQSRGTSKTFSGTTQLPNNRDDNINTPQCAVCRGAHRIYACGEFQIKTPEQRLAEVVRLRLCHNCLRPGHYNTNCRSITCRICRRRHHTLLHVAKASQVPDATETQTPNITSNTAVNFSNQPVNQVILATALIDVINIHNHKTERVRALLDSGSQSTFITTSLKDRLMLQTLPVSNVQIVGIGNTSHHMTSGRCEVQLQSLHTDFNITISCPVMHELTGLIPKYHTNTEHFVVPCNLKLADPHFDVPGPIDVLIGADLYWDIIGHDHRSLGTNMPFLINSKFGYVISGPCQIPSSIYYTNTTNIQCNYTTSENVEFSKQLNLKENLILSDSSSTLGLEWNPSTDSLHIPIQIESLHSSKATKRQVLSSSFKIFDPLGLLSPCTVQPKMLMQQLWARKVEWDEPVPDDIQQEWNGFNSSLSFLTSINIPRHILCDHPSSIELHSFSDASMLAYGACVYLKSIDADGNVLVQLLCAKSKICPIKPTSIPRLELLGALLAARLCKTVTDSLRCVITRSIHWSDSSVVLGWINTCPSKLKTFVANRVVEIVETTQPSAWRYVPTHLNPADLISRGVHAKYLQNNNLWWFGPSFLRNVESEWPTLPRNDQLELPEIKSNISTLHSTSLTNTVIQFNKFSKFTKLRRTLAYVLRFINNTKKNSLKLTSHLTVEELEASFHTLCILAQKEDFPLEYTALHKRHSIPAKNKLQPLTPFLDDQGVMRVGGRLQCSNYGYDKKHPIILQSSHHFTHLIFHYEHLRHMHAGPQLLLYTVRNYIWPIGGRVLARRTVRNCVKCRRLQGRTITPMMGDLPAERVTPSFPFQAVGIDFAGPFSMLNRKGRGAKTSKCYLCLFICLRYKCIHLEAVTELSKDAFILTLRRFIARRGKPSDIFSDNGRNFVAAAREIGQFLHDNLSSLSEFAANESIKFHFNPPYAPHFGGLWEAGIKSAKYHIKRIMGNTNLTYEELSSLFAQVEAILNSRPLCPISSSPHDLLSLTPGHFLVGRPLTSLPTPSLEDKNMNLLPRYTRIEKLRQQFWLRWQKEYLSELQQRSKWHTQKETVRVGELVLIRDDHASPMSWRLGRIDQLFPGPDKISRVADIRTTRGLCRLPLTRLCPLPPCEDSLGSSESKGGSMSAPTSR